MKLPSTDFVTDVEPRIRAYMLQLGISEDLLKQSALPVGPSTVFYDHEAAQHWILIVRFAGYTSAAENGLIMRGWLKRQHPAAVVEREIEQFTRASGGTATTRQTIPRDRN